MGHTPRALRADCCSKDGGDLDKAQMQVGGEVGSGRHGALLQNTVDVGAG